MTHIANGVNLLFPHGERFFVRSVRHYLDRIDDETLRAEVRAFFGQEGRHAHAHEEYFDALRAQGYDIDPFLRTYQKIFDWLERIHPPAFRLAVTVALEHYTAILAEGAFVERAFEQNVHPTMARLLRWHAAEEIEHKAVAFDVLARIAPGYPLRMTGMALATLGLGIFWIAATGTLLAQDMRAGRALRSHDVRVMQARERSIGRDVFLRGLKEYARPDFHPHDRDNSDLATAFLSTLERDAPVA